MHAEAAVHRGAVDAEEDPVRHGGPSRVLRITIETHLVLRFRLQFPEDGGLVGEALGRHGRRNLATSRATERRKNFRRGGGGGGGGEIDGGARSIDRSTVVLARSPPPEIGRAHV